MKIVFATNNVHKLKEVSELLQNDIEVISLKEIGCFEEIEETAETLEGNAKIKTDHVKINYGYDCFADDTGLEVEALDGAPGVYSARYAGAEATFDDNVQKLLGAMQQQTNRSARFRTVISLTIKGQQYFFEGECQGIITTHQHGNKGFGYDPVFRPNGSVKTFAEMNMAEKSRVSHRGMAIRKLVDFLRSQG